MRCGTPSFVSGETARGTGSREFVGRLHCDPLRVGGRLGRDLRSLGAAQQEERHDKDYQKLLRHCTPYERKIYASACCTADESRSHENEPVKNLDFRRPDKKWTRLKGSCNCELYLVNRFNDY